MSFCIRSLNIDEFHLNLIPNNAQASELILLEKGGPILNNKQQQNLCEINIDQLKSSQLVKPLLRNETVINGGHWKPKYCQPKFDSMIISDFIFLYKKNSYLFSKLCSNMER